MSIILFTEWRAVLTLIQYVMNIIIHIVTFASRMIVLMLRRRVTVMTVSNLCVQNVIRFMKGLTLPEDMLLKQEEICPGHRRTNHPSSASV